MDQIGQYIIYSLIGLGALACLIALIWTKLIRPNNSAFTSSFWYIKRQIINLGKNLVQKNKLDKAYYEVGVKLSNENYGYFDYLFIGHDHVYLISNPIYWNINDIKFNQQKFVLLNKKNKEFNLPLDLQIYLKSAKLIQKQISKNEIICLVPCLNKNFKSKKINHLEFIRFDELEKFIQEAEINQESQIITLKNEIEKHLVIKKAKKRFILNPVPYEHSKKSEFK
ncbi:MAG: hypothetical protein ACRCVI_02785 [Mycoplasmoidaceae bacterium]